MSYIASTSFVGVVLFVGIMLSRSSSLTVFPDPDETQPDFSLSSTTLTFGSMLALRPPPRPSVEPSPPPRPSVDPRPPPRPSVDPRPPPRPSPDPRPPPIFWIFSLIFASSSAV